MSRANFCDYLNKDFPNQEAFQWKTFELALKGKRGRKALRDLRDALLALPEKRLISRALCTVGRQATDWATEDAEVAYLVEEQGAGVCAVGAYAWWQRVKAGADPQSAFDDLPLLDDLTYSIQDTVGFGQGAGLTMSLAYLLTDRNDDIYGLLSPEERYERFLAWIDKELASP